MGKTGIDHILRVGSVFLEGSKRPKQKQCHSFGILTSIWSGNKKEKASPL